MSFHSELTELKKLWRLSPRWVKVSLVLSAFFSTSSIASLSATIVSWKGFILSGVDCYQLYIRGPMLLVIRNWTPFHIHPAFVDYAVVMSLATAAVFRGYVLELKVERSLSSRVETIAMLVVCIGSTVGLMYISTLAPPTAAPSMFPAIVSYLVILGVSLLPPRRKWDMLIAILTSRWSRRG